MTPSEAKKQIRDWLQSERIEIKEQPNKTASFQFLFNFPPNPNGHMFNVINPNGRDLIAIGSGTRVDLGQQKRMKKCMEDEPQDWHAWLHNVRLELNRSGIDWSLHLGHDKEKGKREGPLQAFHVSEPTWFDGLSKNAMMQSLRRLWLAKLTVIHEIKHKFGVGLNQPGPVDDWKKQGKMNSPTKDDNIIEGDEFEGFGSGFDPSDWV